MKKGFEAIDEYNKTIERYEFVIQTVLVAGLVFELIEKVK